MKRNLLDILACPKCKAHLISSLPSSEIIDDVLTCISCRAEYPVTNGIPRFVQADNYAASFGYQWNIFRKEQLDSYNGTTLSADRLWSETEWTKDELKDKWILDAGCGAGRFLDPASQSEGQIVGIDISSAIDAAKSNLHGRENVHFVQASIYELPFREGTFDFVYCIGVIQHTPDPSASLKAVANMVKPNGEMAVTIYPRKKWTKLFSKYWLRPVTKRMRKETLLNLVQRLMPFLFPVTDVLFRIPVLGKIFMFTIPVANYVNERQLSRKQRFAWAVLDTFDMLSPFFDQPQTESEATSALSDSRIVEIRRLTNAGLNLKGKKAS